MSTKSYYDNNYDDVQFLVEKRYVDMFGRLVTTFESDDGDILVPLKELKKSGFELYEQGKLPKWQQNYSFDKRRIEQFKVYLTMKAAKFMNTHFKLSQGEVDDLIDNTVSEFFQSPKTPYADSPRTVSRSSFSSLTVTVDNSPRSDIANRKSRPYVNNKARNYSNRPQYENDNNKFEPKWGYETGNNETSKKPLRRPYSSPFVSNDSNRTEVKNSQFYKTPKPKPFSRVSLPLNEPQKVIVTHIESSKVAWVQLVSNHSTLERILVESQKECSEKNCIEPTVDCLCAALFSDLWFRAVVLNTNPLKVQYIDYGNLNEDELKDVRKLSDQLCTIPGQAVRILFDVGSTVSLNTEEILTLRAIEQQSDGTYLVQSVKNDQENGCKPIPSPLKENTSTPNNNQQKQQVDISEQPRNSTESNISSPVNNNQQKPSANVPSEYSKNSSELNVSDSPKFNRENHKRPFERKATVSMIDKDGALECTEVVTNGLVAYAFDKNLSKQMLFLDTIESKCQDDPSFKPNVGDLIAVKHNGIYVRATIINHKNDTYTCALIDYGIIIESSNIRKLPDEYKDICEFACYLKVPSEVAEDIPLNTMMEFSSPGPYKLNIKGKSGTVHQIRGFNWNPFLTSSLAAHQVHKQDSIFYRDQLQKYTLQNNDVVVIIGEQDGRLLLRTKESHVLLKTVVQELIHHKGRPLSKQPSKGQLAICQYGDGQYYRVEVVALINSETVEVEYIDYGNFESVPVKNLLTMNQKLRDIRDTLVKITLKGFKNEKFTKVMVEVLSEYQKSNEKFTAVSENGFNEFDLLTSNKISLSTKLRNINDFPKTVSSVKPVEMSSSSNNPTKVQDKPAVSFVHVDSLPVYPMDEGAHTVICLSLNNVKKGLISICSTAPSLFAKLQKLSEEISKYVNKDTTAYHPQQYEVCLAMFDDEWYRASCQEKVGDQYLLNYIDYGNSHTVSAQQIRKIPTELTQTECLSVKFLLKDLVNDNESIIKEPVLVKIKEALIENECYNIKITKVGKVYEGTIPTLLNSLKESGLL